MLPAPLAGGVTLATTIGLLAILFWARRSLQGLTLMAPWAWAVASAVLLGASALPSWGSHAVRTPWEYMAAISTFCPLMALLGAKRPQHTAWQWVVCSLWVILCLPAFEWWLFHQGHPREMHMARCFFLGVLIVVGVGNMLFTRYAPAAILFGLGQLSLIGPFVADLPNAAAASAPVLGRLLLLAAGLTTLLASRGAAVPTWPLNRVWVDFRDAYGAVWALRQMDRLNATSRQQGWNVVLTWQGFEGPDGESVNHLSSESQAELLDAFRALLTRFVSPAWLAERLRAPATP